MGRRGPKPKTIDQLRVIGSHAPKTKRGSGNTGKPKCPTGLSMAAKRHWKRIVTQLITDGVVGMLDESVLGRYCTLAARLEECEEKIATEGAVVFYSNGSPGKSPWITIANETSKLMIQLEKELGLTPYSR